MGASFKLTNAIDPKIVSDLKSIGDTAKATADNYAVLVAQMAAMTNLNPKGLADLESKASKYKETAEELKKVQAELNKLRGEQEQLLTKVAKEMANEAKIAKDLAKAKKDEAKAALDASKAKMNEVKQQQMLNREKQNQKVTMQEAIELSKKEVHSIAEAEAANKKLRQAVKDITDAEDKDGKIRQQLNSAINVNTLYVKRNRDALVQAKMTVGDYKEQIKLAMTELKNGNNTMKNFGIVAKGFGNLLKTSASDGLRQVGSSVGGMIKGFVGAQAVISGIQALTGALKNGIKTAMSFEAANSQLAAILGTTAEKTKDLQVQARELGSTTKYTAAEATNLQVELAKLGFTTKEIKDSTKYILMFAQATGAELPEAAALSGAALRMFNADTQETERYVSAMAVATSKSALSFSYLATALPIVGPVANAFNFTIEDTLALLGKLSDAGFDASMSATATRNILLNLADANGKLAKSLGEPVKNLPDLVDGLLKLKNSGVDLNTTLELTDKRSVAAFNAFLTAAEKVNPLKEALTDVGDELEAMASTMSDNTAGALKTLDSAWEELMISIYGNTGAVRQFIETCTEGVRWITQLVKSVEDLSAEQEAAAQNAGVSAAEESLKRQEELINASKEAYMKAGKDETEALELAKEERISILASILEEETKLRDEYYQKNQDLWKAQENANFFKQALGLDKTDAEYRDEINASWDKYLQQISYIESLQAQIEGINKMSVKTTQTTNNTSGQIEQSLKELLKIEDDYEAARIELMEEGLDKETALIQLKYNKKIAQIKGNSKKEQQLREMYAEMMYREVAEKQIEYSEKAYEEVLSDEEKQQKKKVDMLKKYSEISATNIVTNEIREETELEDKYRQGLINREEYEKAKFELQKKYNEAALKNAIETAEAMIALMPDGLDKDKAIADLEQAKAKLDKLTKTNFTDGKDDPEKWKDDWTGAVEMVSELFQGVSSIISSSYERRIQAVDKEIEANEEAGQKELERIQELADKGVITTEEAEARKRAAEDRTAKKNEELERKKAALQTKQAKLEKTANIASVIMNTAVAVMKAWGQAGIFGAPMAAMIAAMGAIQLATIIAQPIPKYKHGTKGHKGGLAWVGDGGVSETVITDKGMYLTPNTPTLVDLPKGAQVIPYAIDMERMKARANDLEGLMAYRKENELPPITIENDYSGLQKDIKALESSQRKGFKELAKVIKNQDYKRFAASI